MFSPLFGKRDKDPSTLSVGSTSCRPRGVRLSSLRPTIGNGRLKNDISRSLTGGPTAWDARLEFGMLTIFASGEPPPVFTQIRASGSSGPMTLAPLNRLCALPSQKFACVKTALIIVGVLRGSTRRVFLSIFDADGFCTLKVGSTNGTPWSAA